jgi:hypothetical protein
MRPVGDQALGDALQLLHIRRLGTRRNRCEVRIRSVGARRRRALLGNLAAFQIVPPRDRVVGE